MNEIITVQKIISWEMGHRLSLHQGKCHNLHGHSYKAEIIVKAKGLDKNGMVTDFYNFGPMKEWIDQYLDHAFMLNSDDPIVPRIKEMAEEFQMKLFLVNLEPTAENIAKMILMQAAKTAMALERIYDSPVKHSFYVPSVTVWETPNSSATYIDTRINLPERLDPFAS